MRFLLFLATMLFTAHALPVDKSAMGLIARNEEGPNSSDVVSPEPEHAAVPERNEDAPVIPERNEDAPVVPPRESVELHARDDTDDSSDETPEAEDNGDEQ